MILSETSIEEFPWRRRQIIREIKIHAYSIRQTANVSGEFLRIENKQLKKVQNDSCGQNYHKTTYFCVEAINGKRKIGGKTGSRGANSRLPFGVNVNLNLSIVHNFFYCHFPIRIRHPQVSSPRFADTSFYPIF